MLGTFAGLLATISLLPQLIKVYQTRDVTGISIWMWIVGSTGVGLWVLHGLVMGDAAVVIANTVCLAIDLAILFAVAIFGRKNRKAREAETVLEMEVSESV